MRTGSSSETDAPVDTISAAKNWCETDDVSVTSGATGVCTLSSTSATATPTGSTEMNYGQGTGTSRDVSSAQTGSNEDEHKSAAEKSENNAPDTPTRLSHRVLGNGTGGNDTSLLSAAEGNGEKEVPRQMTDSDNPLLYQGMPPVYTFSAQSKEWMRINGEQAQERGEEDTHGASLLLEGRMRVGTHANEEPFFGMSPNSDSETGSKTQEQNKQPASSGARNSKRSFVFGESPPPPLSTIGVPRNTNVRQSDKKKQTPTSFSDVSNVSDFSYKKGEYEVESTPCETDSHFQTRSPLEDRRSRSSTHFFEESKFNESGSLQAGGSASTIVPAREELVKESKNGRNCSEYNEGEVTDANTDSPCGGSITDTDLLHGAQLDACASEGPRHGSHSANIAGSDRTDIEGTFGGVSGIGDEVSLGNESHEGEVAHGGPPGENASSLSTMENNESSQTRDGHRSNAPKSGPGAAFAVVVTLKKAQNQMDFVTSLEGYSGPLAERSKTHFCSMQEMDLAELEGGAQLRILGDTAVVLCFDPPRPTFGVTYNDGIADFSPCTDSVPSRILVSTSDMVFESDGGSKRSFLYVMNHDQVKISNKEINHSRLLDVVSAELSDSPKLGRKDSYKRLLQGALSRELGHVPLNRLSLSGQPKCFHIKYESISELEETAGLSELARVLDNDLLLEKALELRRDLYVTEEKVKYWLTDDEGLENVENSSLLFLFPTMSDLGATPFPSNGLAEMERRGDEHGTGVRPAHFRVVSRFAYGKDETARLNRQWHQIKATTDTMPTQYSSIGRIASSSVADAFEEETDTKSFRRIEAYLVNIAGCTILVCPADDSDGGAYCIDSEGIRSRFQNSATIITEKQLFEVERRGEALKVDLEVGFDADEDAF